MSESARRYTLSLLVEDKASVLTRVAGLFARRAFNIHSLAVGNTEDKGISRITIITDANDAPIEQIVRQLQKLVNVLRVEVYNESTALEREVALIKLQITDSKQTQKIIEIAEKEDAKIPVRLDDTIIIEFTGSNSKLHTFIEKLSSFNVIEIVRSGSIAIGRTHKTIEDYEPVGFGNNE